MNWKRGYIKVYPGEKQGGSLLLFCVSECNEEWLHVICLINVKLLHKLLLANKECISPCNMLSIIQTKLNQFISKQYPYICVIYATSVNKYIVYI